jgi:hypothetical protein
MNEGVFIVSPQLGGMEIKDNNKEGKRYGFGVCPV